MEHLLEKGDLKNAYILDLKERSVKSCMEEEAIKGHGKVGFSYKKKEG